MSVADQVNVLSPEEYEGMYVDARVEAIQALIPLGLMHIEEELQREVLELAGHRHERKEGGKQLVRYGKNPGSVSLAGQKIAISVPRVRNQSINMEVPLKTYRSFHRQSGQVEDTLLKQVLFGISCRDYESAAQSVPGAIGLSASTTSRHFIKATAKKLKEFQERDLSDLDIVGMWIDGKTFAEDTMVIALGLTMEGRKVPLGFVQAGTENGKVIEEFLRELIDRGLRIESGLLVVLDGGKGLRSAVKKAFKKKALVQRCQWHKRENVLSYLPKSEQDGVRRRLQKAYKKPTYDEAKGELNKILEDLYDRNLNAARSLEEGFEETLTLHRLGVFAVLGISLKTSNCIESIMSMVEDRCGKVDHWKNSSHKHRWLSASLLDIEPRLSRIKGYKHLPLLREALQSKLKIMERKSVA